MTSPLHGVTILDITSVVMGPYATQVLSDLGAKVIKVEGLGGDDTRHAAPMRNAGMGHRFLHLNRGKRSLTLNLKHKKGREALLRLSKFADVLIYNIRPQAMARLGLAYQDIKVANPKIIYVGTYGFSQSGPYAARPAYDDLIQGMVAIPWLIAQSGAGQPHYIPTTICDRIVGLHAVYAITAALYQLAMTGEGQEVEVPMFEVMAEMVLQDHLGGRTFVPQLGAAGYNRVLAPGRRPFPTLDGHICVLIYNDKQWASFIKAVSIEAGEDVDPRLATHEGRANNAAAVNAFIAERLSTRTTAEWIRILSSADIPASPMYSLDNLIDDPHLSAFGLISEVEHPTEGSMLSMSAPVRWVNYPGQPYSPPPQLGQHSAEVLTEAGYSRAEITDMVREGITSIGKDNVQ